MIHWNLKPFEELTRLELYQILKARQEVFVEEQNIVYVDCDGKDFKCQHLFAQENGTPEIAAYLRILPPGLRYSEWCIGRVLTQKPYRNLGLGRHLMSKALEWIETQPHPKSVRLSAQKYLESFYQSLGFSTVSEPYVEEGIEHIEMLRP